MSDKYINSTGLSTLATWVTTKLSNKVDKINGKQLSTEDFTTAEKTKLSNLSEYTAGTGIDITNGVISLDYSIVDNEFGGQTLTIG